MITLIILIAVFLLGLVIARESELFDIFGVVLCILSITLIIIHIASWATSWYIADKLIAQRSAFVETLEYARNSNNQIELAAISRDISQFNQGLAILKYQNKMWFLDPYIDDRIDDIKPIR